MKKLKIFLDLPKCDTEAKTTTNYYVENGGMDVF